MGPFAPVRQSRAASAVHRPDAGAGPFFAVMGASALPTTLSRGKQGLQDQILHRPNVHRGLLKGFVKRHISLDVYFLYSYCKTKKIPYKHSIIVV